MAKQSMFYKCPYCETAQEFQPHRDHELVHCKNPRCGKPFELDLPEASPSPYQQRKLIVPGEDERTEPEEDRAPKAHPVGRSQEQVLKEVRPAIFRRYPFRTALFSTLTILGILFIIPGVATQFYALVVLGTALAGIGLCFLVKWLVWAKGARLTITTERSILRHGFLKKQVVDVSHRDIDHLHVHKSRVNRVMQTGDLAIAVKGSNKKLVLLAAPHPETLANTIRGQFGNGNGEDDKPTEHPQ